MPTNNTWKFKRFLGHCKKNKVSSYRHDKTLGICEIEFDTGRKKKHKNSVDQYTNNFKNDYNEQSYKKRY